MIDSVTGQNIGFSFAECRMPIPENAPECFLEGYNHGLIATKHRTTDYFDRKQLRLRYSAWTRGRVFDDQVTAEFLRSIHEEECPILRLPLTRLQGPDHPMNESVDRVYNNSAYTPKNLYCMSHKANAAKGKKTFLSLHQLWETGEYHRGLSGAEWGRLTYLSYVSEYGLKREHPDLLIPLMLFIPRFMTHGNPVTILQCMTTYAAMSKDSLSCSYLSTLMHACKTHKQKRALEECLNLLRYWIGYSYNSFHYKSDHRQLHKSFEDAWTQPGVFESWLKWVHACGSTKTLTNYCLRQAPADKQDDPFKLNTRGFVIPK